MKYIIPENKLDNIIFKYLDINLKGIEKKKPKYYKGFVFAFPNEEFGVLGWEKPNKLYIYRKLIEDISNSFGLNEIDSESVITRWVEDRLKLKVARTSQMLLQYHLRVEDRLKLEVARTKDVIFPFLTGLRID